MPLAAPLRVGAALLLTTALAGCGSDQVPITSPTPDAVDRSACTALLDALPTTVADELRRPVDPEDALGAAFGDPAIVVVCGGGMPAEFDEFSPCVVFDGVGWYIPEDQLGDEPLQVTMTTVGISPVVAVTIPAVYWPEGAATVQADLGSAITTTLTRESRCR